MRRISLGSVVAIALVAVQLGTVASAAAGQQANTRSVPAGLSPYWGEAITQWEPIILEEAERRGLDPDLIAAVMWKESHGRQYARGPAGAVGLMMVMPKEAGFSWRPTVSELQDPWRNIFWGARALSIIIKQSHGDVFNALAAYNGGWEQIHIGSTRRYAADVLAYYTRAVAMRYGISPEGPWVATIAATNAPDVVTVYGPQMSLVRYTQRPIIAEIPEVGTTGSPSVLTFDPVEEEYANCRVGVWLVLDGRVVGVSSSAYGTGDPAPTPPPAVMDEWSLIVLAAGGGSEVYLVRRRKSRQR